MPRFLLRFVILAIIVFLIESTGGTRAFTPPVSVDAYPGPGSNLGSMQVFLPAVWTRMERRRRGADSNAGSTNWPTADLDATANLDTLANADTFSYLDTCANFDTIPDGNVNPKSEL